MKLEHGHEDIDIISNDVTVDDSESPLTVISPLYYLNKYFTVSSSLGQGQGYWLSLNLYFIFQFLSFYCFRQHSDLLQY